MKNKTKFQKKIFKNKDSNSDEEMLQIAFDVDEELNVPENYKLDEINQQSVEFLKFVKIQRQNLELKNENLKSIDLEFNLNVNNDIIFRDIYEKLNIDNYWINEIKKEFTNLQNELKNFKKLREKHITYYNNVGDLIKDYNFYFESIKYISIPYDNIIHELCTKLTNKLCIKLINHFSKILSKITIDEEKILIWLYYLLAMIEMPIVDEDNSVLYTLNKSLLKNLICNINEENPSRESIGKKITFVIISEIFGQKVMIKI